MPVIYGPHNTSWEPYADHEKLAFRCEANSLGQAIHAYEQAFNVSITPYDGRDAAPDETPRYFMYASTSPSGEREEFLVDIHIERNGGEICPKQDLTFHLLFDDVLQIWTGMVC